MSKYQVRITRHAYRQLEEILQYIEWELMAPDAAKQVLLSIRKQAASLEDLPARFPLLENEKWNQKGIRKVPVKNVILYYWINEAEHTVQIIAVLADRMDQLQYLTSAWSRRND